MIRRGPQGENNVSREYAEVAIRRWSRCWLKVNDHFRKTRGTEAVGKWAMYLNLMAACGKYLAMKKVGAPGYVAALWARPFNNEPYLIQACEMFDVAEARLVAEGN